MNYYYRLRAWTAGSVFFSGHIIYLSYAALYLMLYDIHLSYIDTTAGRVDEEIGARKSEAG